MSAMYLPRGSVLWIEAKDLLATPAGTTKIWNKVTEHNRSPVELSIDRIGPLGAQQEGFIPNIAKAAMSGFMYPNINTMPRYNIPSNTISGVGGGPNNSYNNNVYNIDIALNGTNVTADDVMRKFEEKMSAINARQGRPITVKPNSRSFGGNH